MTYKYVAQWALYIAEWLIYVTNRLSDFGGILFTHVQLTAVAWYAAVPLKVRLHSRTSIYSLHLLNPSTNTDIYVDTS